MSPDGIDSRSFSNAHAATRCVAIATVLLRNAALPELARVLCIAGRIVAHATVGVGQVRQRIDHVTPRVPGHTVLVDLVADAVERLREADDATRVEAEELADEGGHATGT